jgi:hypothetical protein
MSLALTEKQTREIEALCQIARENGAVISLRELIGLAAIDASEPEFETAFRSDSKLRSRFQLESGYVLDRLPAPQETSKSVEKEDRRRERARMNLAQARRFGQALLRGTVLVSVSGGTSYLSASEKEDIDFFCVTKTDGMWPFMLKALILARIQRMAHREVPELCFSCIMDESWATKAFRATRQPIFARDALTARVIGGMSGYGSLLREAAWMESIFPALYRARLGEAEGEGRRSTPKLERGRGRSAVLNSFIYYTLGSFLRVKSWALNRKFAKAEWHSSLFETRIGKGHYIYESNRYVKLRKMYSELETEGE